MKHYLFRISYDDTNPELIGEEFIVGADSEGEAVEIATNLFSIVRYVDVLTEEEAEMSGLDEY